MMFAVAARSQDLISADRPGIADASTVVGEGVLQIEIGGQVARQPDVREWTTPTLVRYGLTPKLEARLESDLWSRTRVTAGGLTSSDSGFAPISAGVKYQFRDSLGVIARLVIPSGTDAFKEDSVGGDVRLAGDFALGEKWALNPNIGFAVADDGGRFASAIAAVTLGYNVSDRLQPFADVALQSPEERGGDTSVVFDGGVSWIVTPDTQLDISAGTGVAGSTPADFFWSAGISHRF
jgi:hypothetical protein